MYKCDLAEHLFQLDRGAEATAIVEDVLRGADSSNLNRTLFPTLMSHYANSKDADGFRQTVAKWESQMRVDDYRDLYNTACYRALFAAMLKSSEAPDSVRVADEEANRAMDWLSKAVRAGYYRIEHMDQDHDLDVLRERPDFQTLMTEIRRRLTENKLP